jgi:predicted DNA-binding transcriptional regulator AlpA
MKNQNVTSRLLSDKESARYLGISRSTLREYVNKGILHRVLLPHPSGIGYIHRMLIDISDLDAFIDSLKMKKME